MLLCAHHLIISILRILPIGHVQSAGRDPGDFYLNEPSCPRFQLYATSFPQPILLGATFDDDLIKQVATVVSTECRAFGNAGRAGLDFWTPNINPFKDPRWGRGQETPGEDPLHISRYVYQLVDGLQNGIGPAKPKIVSTCKHFAAYDLEDWDGVVRHDFDAVVSTQDLSEFYLPPFKSCTRDAKVDAVMCSYNAVNGVPSCADSYLLQTILRDHWVTSDCGANRRYLQRP